jgi:hypothetical protein
MNRSFTDVDRAGYPTPHVQCSGPDGCAALMLGANRHMHLAWHERRDAERAEQERQFQRVWAAIKALGGVQ